MTPRRVGSASAPSVRSRLLRSFTRAPRSLHEPPKVTFGIERAVRSIGPVVVAIVVGVWLAHDLRTGGGGVCMMRVDVVDV